MLANESNANVSTGTLAPGLHRPRTWLSTLIDFIADQLPRWRDRDDRPRASSETVLTAQLCKHLNGAARKSDGWDILQFRTEEPDERQRSRSIDLAPAPAGDVIWIEGRRYSDFDILLPIECKRLPTPAGRDRDKREYLRVSKGSTGGIQRFKAGLHGSVHEQGVMIGYIQAGDIRSWTHRIDRWIRALARAGIPDWSDSDRLRLIQQDGSLRTATLWSNHDRTGNLPPIALNHLWIEI